MKTSPDAAPVAPEPAYHDGSRRWQDRFDSRRLAEDHTPPVPAWKSFEAFRDVLPSGDAAGRSDATDPPVRPP